MKDIALTFAALALDAARDLPANERADIYDFAADFFKAHAHGDIAQDAEAVATAIREAEAGQLHFLRQLTA